MKNDDIFNSDEFKKACEDVCEKIAAEYPNEGKHKHTFSKELDERIAELSRKNHKRRFRLLNTVGKRIAVIAVVLALIIATVFSVEAVRVPVIDFFVRVYKEFTSLFIDTDDRQYDDQFEFTPKSPSYMPEGVEIEEEYHNPSMYQINYLADSGTKYYFKQDRLYQNQIVDNEKYSDVLEENGKKYYYYIFDDNQSLVWYDDQYSYMIFGKISKDEMLNIALSVK